MRVLITAGPTYEPIDPVRFIGNRSSGQMGAALATAAVEAGHEVTLILEPVTAAMPQDPRIRRVDIFSSRDLLDAVLREFPSHDLLIMAAAVADFRPKQVRTEKAERGGTMTIELEATEDIVAVGRERGYQRLRLDTIGGKMHQALALYRSMGFVEIPPYYASPIPDTAYLELVL